MNRTSQRRSDTRSHSFRLVISVLLETGRKWRRWILVNLFTHQALLPKAATCFLFFFSLSFFLKAFQSDKTPVLPPAGRMMLLSRQPQDGPPSPPDTHAHTHFLRPVMSSEARRQTGAAAGHKNTHSQHTHTYQETWRTAVCFGGRRRRSAVEPWRTGGADKGVQGR